MQTKSVASPRIKALHHLCGFAEVESKNKDQMPSYKSLLSLQLFDFHKKSPKKKHISPSTADVG